MLPEHCEGELGLTGTVAHPQKMTMNKLVTVSVAMITLLAILAIPGVTQADHISGHDDCDPIGGPLPVDLLPNECRVIAQLMNDLPADIENEQFTIDRRVRQ